MNTPPRNPTGFNPPTGLIEYVTESIWVESYWPAQPQGRFKNCPDETKTIFRRLARAALRANHVYTHFDPLPEPSEPLPEPSEPLPEPSEPLPEPSEPLPEPVTEDCE